MSSPGHRKRSADFISSDTEVGSSSSSSASSSSSSSPNTTTTTSNDAMGPHLDIDAVKDELTCNICLDLPHRVATVLPCLHNFCWACIQEWFKAHAKCPRCSQASTEAKPNPALTNLVQLLVKADASFAKPAETIAQEDIAFNEYKASHGSVAKIIPGRSLYDEDTDDDGDDDDIEDILPVIWPCPCCSGNNRSGYTCSNPIPPPEEHQRNRAQPPQRGHGWPELDLIAEYVSFEVMTQHTECGFCSRWIPSNGVPQAQCQGCSITTCSPYDETGLCPETTHPFAPLKDHPAITSTLQRSYYAIYPTPPTMWPTELTRLKDYMSSNNISPRQIYDKVMSRAVAVLTASGSAVNENQTEASAATSACLTSVDHICNEDCRTLNKAKADAIVNGFFCESCAIQSLRAIIYMWWDDIHRNHRQTLPETTQRLPDCWWGRECRTQSHKPSHAESYNHMCENVRGRELAEQAAQTEQAEQAAQTDL